MRLEGKFVQILLQMYKKTGFHRSYFLYIGMGRVLNQYVRQERLGVAVRDCCDVKLLGVPAYETGTDEYAGHLISSKSCELLKEWGCSENVKCMVFDTTAANTGHVTAACVTIQDELNRCIMWCACQHHVGEVILVQCFKDLNIEASKSPEVSLFIRLRDNWDQITKDGPPDHLKIEGLSTEALAVISKLKQDLYKLQENTEDFVRDDYKEFLTLAVAFVNEEVTKISYNRPGALHKARWMMRVIYSLKLVTLESAIQQLDKGTITSNHDILKLRDFATFCSLVYCPFWFQCTVAVDAPKNLLKLYQNILCYKIVNDTLSTSAEKALKRHSRFLVLFP